MNYSIMSLSEDELQYHVIIFIIFIIHHYDLENNISQLVIQPNCTVQLNEFPLNYLRLMNPHFRACVVC